MSKKVLVVEDYADDFSAQFTDNSQVSKKYVDDAIANAPPTSANLISFAYIAGENLNAGEVVYMVAGEVFKLTPGTLVESREIGVTMQSCLIGGIINVAIEGYLDITGFGLIPDTVYYCGANGALTATKPTSNIIKVGVAITSDILLVSINELSSISATDLAVANITAITLDVTSSTGNDATLPQATTLVAGLLSAADKRAIDDVFINILIFG